VFEEDGAPEKDKKAARLLQNVNGNDIFNLNK
jgi:hypothetical protein